MIRSTAGRAAVFALAALVSSTAIVNCSRKDPVGQSNRTGSVGFSLILRTNVTVNSIDYKISGNGISPITGAIDVPGTTARALISGIPAGMGYVVALTAVSTDGKTNCLGAATFNIIEGQTVEAKITMQCKGPGAGVLSIAGTFDNCPVLTSVMAMPMSAPMTGMITLKAGTSDPDGDPLTYSWTQSPPPPPGVSSGFAKDTSANTTFTCFSAGSSTLTLAVSDGTCISQLALTVCCGALTSCAASGSGGAGGSGNGGAVGSGGGTGTGGSGEGTGGYGTGTGGTIAGTGGSRTGTGGSGTGTGGSGTGTGGSVVGTGGSGTGTGGSVAGTGGTGTGGAAVGTGGTGTGTGGAAVGTGGSGTGTGGAATGGSGTGGGGTGGSGTGGGGTGGGSGGSGTGGGTGGSNNACAAGTPPSHCNSLACDRCTTDNCFPATDGCDTVTDSADKQLCETAYACFVAPTHPGSAIPGACVKGGDPTTCWCGTNPTTCLTDVAAANGPCRDAVVAAAKSSDPGTIKLRFVDPGFPLGHAVNLSSCRGSFCGAPPNGNDECKIPEFVFSSP